MGTKTSQIWRRKKTRCSQFPNRRQKAVQASSVRGQWPNFFSSWVEQSQCFVSDFRFLRISIILFPLLNQRVGPRNYFKFPFVCTWRYHIQIPNCTNPNINFVFIFFIILIFSSNFFLPIYWYQIIKLACYLYYSMNTALTAQGTCELHGWFQNNCICTIA